MSTDRTLLHRLLKLEDSHAGNGQAFEMLHGNEFCYDHDRNLWLQWDALYWELDRNGAAERAGLDVAFAKKRAAAEINHRTDAKRRFDFALRSESNAGVTNTLRAAQRIRSLAKNTSDFDRHPFLFTVGNGTLNLKSGKLQDPNPKDMITRASTVPYDPDSTCPLWEKVVGEVFEDDRDLTGFVKRVFGYGMTGDIREQCIFLFYGGGSNGKSTVVETIAEVMGGHASTTPFSTFLIHKYPGAPRDDLAALCGARLVRSAEGAHGAALDESVIKLLSGGEQVACRHLFGRWFSYVPEYKVILVSNHQPEIKGTDDAIWRRLVVIPFNRQFTEAERDKGLRDRLRSEYPGILNWLLAGCREWLADGLGSCRAVDEATAKYRQTSDLVGNWMADYCEFSREFTETGKDLFLSLCRWAKTAEEKPPTMKAFFADLERRRSPDGRPFKKRKTMVGVVFDGLKVKDGTKHAVLVGR